MLKNITKPTLILDKNRAITNIRQMAKKARISDVVFRPHFKTHQSAEIGEWFRKDGVQAITVSSLEMAQYFARNGWNDITIAFPVNLLEIPVISELAKSIRLGVLVDSDIAVKKLSEELKALVNVWIKVDVGYGRVGIPWEQWGKIVSLAKHIQNSSNLTFEGILTHNGHSYYAQNIAEIRAVYTQAHSRLLSVKEILSTSGLRTFKVSTGDTPCCSIIDDFEGVDEIRPGNFVFYDVTQASKGVCSYNDIAVAVACPVVGKYEERNQIVIHGGGVHLSKEFIADVEGNKLFGYLSNFCGGESIGSVNFDAPVVSLSQEHGTVNVSGKLFERVNIGDVVLVFPIHSCMTCNLFDEYVTLDGGRVSRI
ncbi:MAG: alanine racemase [Calditrichaeota bacterium]|nr:alanine racemase [Calditrichota bacterium]